MDANENRAEYQPVLTPRRPGDWSPLTGSYVETVVGSLLRPPPNLLARRLGHFVDSHRPRASLSIDDLGAGLSLPPARVIAGLRRLYRHGPVFSPAEGMLGVSGFAPTLTPEQLARVNVSSQLEHRRLAAQPPGAVVAAARVAAGVLGAARRLVARSW